MKGAFVLITCDGSGCGESNHDFLQHVLQTASEFSFLFYFSGLLVGDSWFHCIFMFIYVKKKKKLLANCIVIVVESMLIVILSPKGMYDMIGSMNIE